MYPFADPFADATKGDDLLPAGTEDYIHIRIQQRNGRKTLTTVQGIADDYDKKKLVKAFKKVQVLGRRAENRVPGEGSYAAWGGGEMTGPQKAAFILVINRYLCLVSCLKIRRMSLQITCEIIQFLAFQAQSLPFCDLLVRFRLTWEGRAEGRQTCYLNVIELPSSY